MTTNIKPCRKGIWTDTDQMYYFIGPSGYLQHELTQHVVARLLRLSEQQYLRHFGSRSPALGSQLRLQAAWRHLSGCSVHTEVSYTARWQWDAGVK